jgi:hypothetical protein
MSACTLLPQLICRTRLRREGDAFLGTPCQRFGVGHALTANAPFAGRDLPLTVQPPGSFATNFSRSSAFRTLPFALRGRGSVRKMTVSGTL